MISFIIPAYNSEKRIGKCVAAIVEQDTNIDYEILIVNDGSSDETSSKAKELEKKYSQVRVVDKENGGVSSARNAGIKNAKGDYIVFCDSDDSIASGFFEAIRGQDTNIDYEILIVNDGSSDETSSKAKELEKKYSQVRVVDKENGGVSSARNAGIKNAKGDYIVFCDSDDSIASGFFEAIRGYENYDLTVYGYKYIVKEKTSLIVTESCDLHNKEQAFMELYGKRLFNQVWNKIYKKSLISDLFEEKYFIGEDLSCDLHNKEQAFMELYGKRLFNQVWNKIYKKSLISDLFEEKYFIGEDLLFNIRYFSNVSNIHVLPDALYNYIITSGSITQSYREKYVENFTECLLHLRDFKRQLGNDECLLIEKDYIDNVIGTIGLLINYADYSIHNKVSEMKRIYKIFEDQKINCRSDVRFNNIIVSLLSHHMYLFVMGFIGFKRTVKKILKK